MSKVVKFLVRDIRVVLTIFEPALKDVLDEDWDMSTMIFENGKAREYKNE